ncbi:MAG: hypothetical protein P8129_24610 [Anaerolineae bacterium]
MKNYKAFVSLGLAAVIVLAAIGIGYTQGGSEPALQPPVGQHRASQIAASDVVSPTFSYQGVLKQDGQPVTGSRDLTFRLYSDPGCVDLLGTPSTYTVDMSDGLFNVALQVDPASVDGRALWLEIDVDGVVLGCQRIQAAPYALGLRPGAIVSGTVPGGAAMAVVNASADGPAVQGLADLGTVQDVHPGAAFAPAGGEFAGQNGVIGAASPAYAGGYGVVGLAPGDAGHGVLGMATSAEGPVSGVYGQSASTGGHGVTGWAQATSGTTAGVYGQTDSSDGTGGYFTNQGSNLGLDLIAGSGGGGTDGRISSDPAYGDSDLSLYSMDTVSVHLDENDDGESSLTLYNGADERVFRIDEAGDLSGNWATEESDTTIRCRDALAVHLNDDGSGTSGAINIYDDNDQLCLVLSDNGNIYKLCGGTSSAVVEAEDGVPRRLYVVESPEVWLEDLGTGRLDDGGAVVAIEPLFLSTINTQIPYHVFVTPLGDCKGLYVTDKTATSFAVRELSGGTSQVEFEYRIIAKRRGWEEARMEPAPVEPGGASPPDEGNQ